MIKGRENKLLGVAPSAADLLVCFPSRAHLTLMPKPICSPARPSEPTKRHHHLKRINTRAAAGATGGPNSPLMWAKNNQMRNEIAEPTSPKVTCAGQIKVRPRSSSTCRNWQSVMEEIERIHNRGKHKKKSKWGENFGFKKDVMNFLTCLRNIRFDFRCFGSFPEAVITSDDDDDDEDYEDDEFEVNVEDIHCVNNNNNKNNNDSISANNDNNAVFSKWFMVLQDDNVNQGKHSFGKKTFVINEEEVEDDEAAPPAVPPPNALLLMRCRSAPAKSWLEEKQEEEDKEKEVKVEEVKEFEEEKGEKKHRKRESLGNLMKYDVDFNDFGSEVAQETWVVGGIKDHFSRSRSWRR